MSQNKPPRFGGSNSNKSRNLRFRDFRKKITHQKGKWSRRLVNHSWKKSCSCTFYLYTQKTTTETFDSWEIVHFQKIPIWHPFWKKKTVQNHQVQQSIPVQNRPPHLQIEAANLSKLGFLWCCAWFLLGYPDPLHSIFWDSEGLPLLRKMIEMLQPKKDDFNPQKTFKKPTDFTSPKTPSKTFTFQKQAV